MSISALPHSHSHEAVHTHRPSAVQAEEHTPAAGNRRHPVEVGLAGNLPAGTSEEVAKPPKHVSTIQSYGLATPGTYLRIVTTLTARRRTYEMVRVREPQSPQQPLVPENNQPERQCPTQLPEPIFFSPQIRFKISQIPFLRMAGSSERKHTHTLWRRVVASLRRLSVLLLWSPIIVVCAHDE
ncbi:hypothetical protein P691DRAFT_111205 [Macrolepiota fuliginosa MF-IS2]|uniref:Uncharacterized protein n=1 Tax=Macrolepiota fuliginosa MF-IS2 TaxID=1400762 RepID=A0A9P6C3J1_9AGAR|nr:hypothetical protein P691DRAFT_111205 [Macrolepiota fuliginosa MF-IS2]